MTPLELAEIQLELGLSNSEFAQALGIKDTGMLANLKTGAQHISQVIASSASWMLDDCRYARLILEKKIQPQFEDLVEAGEKPEKIVLVIQLDRDKSAQWTAAKPQARLGLYKQIDKLAKIFFESREVDVVSKVEFIKAPEPKQGEEPPDKLSVLGVRVEAV